MQTNKPNIAVLSLNSNKYSETFIHNQIKYLPAKVHCLYDGSLPKFGPNGVQFEVDEKSLSNFLFRKFTGITTVEQQEQSTAGRGDRGAVYSRAQRVLFLS